MAQANDYQWLAILIKQLVEQYQTNQTEEPTSSTSTTTSPSIPDDEQKIVPITVESGSSDHKSGGYQWISVPPFYDLGPVTVDGTTCTSEIVQGKKYYYIQDSKITAGKLRIETASTVYTATIIKETAPEKPSGVNSFTMTAHDYRGHGGPLFYGYRPASELAGPLTISIPGANGVKRTVNFNGVRYQANGMIIKQSDVAGRGFTVLWQNSACYAETCTVTF
jgi:hypothetical protein